MFSIKLNKFEGNMSRKTWALISYVYISWLVNTFSVSQWNNEKTGFE
jgi:hypothetical protein